MRKTSGAKTCLLPKPGRGGLDYGTYLREVTSLGREVPLLLEHLRTPEEYEEARQFIVRKAAEEKNTLA